MLTVKYIIGIKIRYSYVGFKTSTIFISFIVIKPIYIISYIILSQNKNYGFVQDILITIFRTSTKSPQPKTLICKPNRCALSSSTKHLSVLCTQQWTNEQLITFPLQNFPSHRNSWLSDIWVDRSPISCYCAGNGISLSQRKMRHLLDQMCYVSSK